MVRTKESLQVCVTSNAQYGPFGGEIRSRQYTVTKGCPVLQTGCVSHCVRPKRHLGAVRRDTYAGEVCNQPMNKQDTSQRHAEQRKATHREVSRCMSLAYPIAIYGHYYCPVCGAVRRDAYAGTQARYATNKQASKTHRYAMLSR